MTNLVFDKSDFHMSEVYVEEVLKEIESVKKIFPEAKDFYLEIVTEEDYYANSQTLVLGYTRNETKEEKEKREEKSRRLKEQAKAEAIIRFRQTKRALEAQGVDTSEL